MKTIIRVVLAVMALTLCSAFAGAQTKCLGPDEVKTMLAQVDSPRNVAFDKKLRDELLKLAGKTEKLIYHGVEKDLSNDDLSARSRPGYYAN